MPSLKGRVKMRERGRRTRRRERNRILTVSKEDGHGDLRDTWGERSNKLSAMVMGTLSTEMTQRQRDRDRDRQR